MRIGAAIIISILAAPGPAFAFPDGAPWGSADPTAEENCSSCHFDSDPVLDSDSIYIDGLPIKWESAGEFLLTVWLKDNHAKKAGFLVFASDGEFMPDDQRDVKEREIRSVQSARLRESVAEWQVIWKAPEGPARPISFLLAVNAANDDDSPLGDKIHYKQAVIQFGE